ncbi:cupin domain-containing protein [Alcaligenaceae bacterium 429]|nr:cupin domain-containing protein [Alcaligenaceae bacterium 429]
MSRVYSPTDPADESFRFGLRIRELRQQAGLTLQQVANLSGMSAGLISQIERNLTDPSMRSLRMLSMALGTPIARFFDEPEHHHSSERYIVRHDEQRRLILNKAGMSKYLTSPDSPGLIEAYLIILEPGARSGEVKYMDVTGEKFCYVLEGKLQVSLDNHSVLLETGDSFRIPTHTQHSFANTSDKPCRFLWNIVLLDKPNS